MNRAHTIVLKVRCRADGIDLDSLLDAIEHLENVRSAIDVDLFVHGTEARTEQVAITVPADGQLDVNEESEDGEELEDAPAP